MRSFRYAHFHFLVSQGQVLSSCTLASLILGLTIGLSELLSILIRGWEEEMRGDEKIGPVKFLSINRTFFFFFLMVRMTNVLQKTKLFGFLFGVDNNFV